MQNRLPILLAGGLILIQAFLIFAPLQILGAAINWPASLDFPPAEVLPLIREELPGVRLGYGVYLVYSLLWAVTGTVIAWLAVRRDGRFGPWLALTAGLACASALARAIGIIRWLTASTALADAHAQPGADQSAIEAVQLAVNAWGGAIGENLGVAIFAGLWALVVSLMMLRAGVLLRWIGVLGLPVALVVMAPALEMFGVSVISIMISTTALHIWLMALGVAVLWQAVRSERPASEG